MHMGAGKAAYRTTAGFTAAAERPAAGTPSRVPTAAAGDLPLSAGMFGILQLTQHTFSDNHAATALLCRRQP